RTSGGPCDARSAKLVGSGKLSTEARDADRTRSGRHGRGGGGGGVAGGLPQGCPRAHVERRGRTLRSRHVHDDAGRGHHQPAGSGSLIDLTLVGDGGTTGRLFVPAPKPGTADFDAGLAGTWTLVADTVTLTHAADTFLRDMPLRVAGTRLEGDKTFSVVQIVVVLQKQ